MPPQPNVSPAIGSARAVAPRSAMAPIVILAVLAGATIGVSVLYLNIPTSGMSGAAGTWPTLAWPEGNLADSAFAIVRGARYDPALFTTMGFRLTRVVLALLAGMALSASGVALQALLRNALAEPFVLGLSTGAALGVATQSVLAGTLAVSLGPQYQGALIGSGAAMAIVFLASHRRGVLDPLGLLLTGVVLSTVCGAIIMSLNYLRGPGDMNTVNLARWMMGQLNTPIVGSAALPVSAGCIGLGIVVLTAYGRSMDIATFSDAEAISMGVHLGRLRAILFIVASVLAGCAVVVAGPLAFVGLICPHLARLLLGPRHRPLIIGAVLLGGMLLVLAEIAVKVIDYRYNTGLMPLGIFTAMIGGPAFILMLHPRLGGGE